MDKSKFVWVIGQQTESFAWHISGDVHSDKLTGRQPKESLCAVCAENPLITLSFLWGNINEMTQNTSQRQLAKYKLMSS